MNLSPPTCTFCLFLLGLLVGVADLARSVSSTCCNALFNAIALTGSLSLLIPAPGLSLDDRLPMTVGGVLLRGGDNIAGVSASVRFCCCSFVASTRGGSSALGEPMVCGVPGKFANERLTGQYGRSGCRTNYGRVVRSDIAGWSKPGVSLELVAMRNPSFCVPSLGRCSGRKFATPGSFPCPAIISPLSLGMVLSSTNRIVAVQRLWWWDDLGAVVVVIVESDDDDQ